MDVWTEIVAEDIADVHVGTREVIVPLDDDVDHRRVRNVTDELLARRLYREQMDELREMMEAQERMRDILEGTEYEGMV